MIRREGVWLQWVRLQAITSSSVTRTCTLWLELQINRNNQVNKSRSRLDWKRLVMKGQGGSIYRRILLMLILWMEITIAKD
jgi:hypothetical protein